MTTNKAVAAAGFEEAQFRMLEAVCRDLSAGGTRVVLQEWDGTRKDLVLINPENPVVAESARRLTTQRGGQYLLLIVRSLRVDDMAARGALRAQLATALHLSPSSSGKQEPAASDGGTPLYELLRDLIADGVNVSASCSSCHVLILPDAGKVRARNDVAFGMLRTFFSRTDWVVQPLHGPVDMSQYGVSRSLESLLIDACLRIRFRLPSVESGPFRLNTYPDLGELTGHSDVLNLASFAMHPQPTVKALADQAQTEITRANAFVFAATMLGLIEAVAIKSDGPAILESGDVRTERRSIWSRIARRFGLGAVREEREDV